MVSLIKNWEETGGARLREKEPLASQSHHPGILELEL